VQELAQQIDAQELPEPTRGNGSAETNIQHLAQALAEAEQELKVQQETQQRLLQEQRKSSENSIS
jgi:chromosome segregation protein